MKRNKEIGYCRKCGKSCHIWNKIIKRGNDFDTAFEVFDRQVLVDSSKKIGWVEKNYVRDRDKIIVLIRNGLDVMGSCKNRGQFNKDRIKSWVDKTSKILKYVEDKDYVILKYEHMYYWIEYICDWIGIECFVEKSPHFIGGCTSLYNGKIISKRQELLSVSETKLFNKMAGKLNRKLGYEI